MKVLLNVLADGEYEVYDNITCKTEVVTKKDLESIAPVAGIDGDEICAYGTYQGYKEHLYLVQEMFGDTGVTYTREVVSPLAVDVNGLYDTNSFADQFDERKHDKEEMRIAVMGFSEDFIRGLAAEGKPLIVSDYSDFVSFQEWYIPVALQELTEIDCRGVESFNFTLDAEDEQPDTVRYGKLHTLYLPYAFFLINAYAFQCSTIRHLYADHSHEDMRKGESMLFAGAFLESALQTVDLSCYNLQKIGQYAFRDCKGLKEVKLPKNLLTIQASAFQGCGELSHIDFPATLAHIMEKAFYLCGLHSVKLPPSVITMEGKCFGRCEEMQEIDFDASLEVGAEFQVWFSGCCNVRRVRFGEHVKGIHLDAFTGFRYLETVELPETGDVPIYANLTLSAEDYPIFLVYKGSPTYDTMMQLCRARPWLFRMRVIEHEDSSATA